MMMMMLAGRSPQRTKHTQEGQASPIQCPHLGIERPADWSDHAGCRPHSIDLPVNKSGVRACLVVSVLLADESSSTHATHHRYGHGRRRHGGTSTGRGRALLRGVSRNPGPAGREPHRVLHLQVRDDLPTYVNFKCDGDVFAPQSILLPRAYMYPPLPPLTPKWTHRHRAGPDRDCDDEQRKAGAALVPGAGGQGLGGLRWGRDGPACQGTRARARDERGGGMGVG